jgi:hypothetical protein
VLADIRVIRFTDCPTVERPFLIESVSEDGAVETIDYAKSAGEGVCRALEIIEPAEETE